MQIDLHVHDADVLTLDGPGTGSRARGLAIHDGRVLALLDDGSLPAGVTARRAVGCGGAVVVPGFGDAHNHMAWFGQTLAEIDLSDARTLDEVYDAVAARAGTLPEGAFVVGAGYDDVRLGGSPHHAALDRAAGGRPVRLQHRSGHVCAGSTEALRRAGILDASGRRGPVAVPEGGKVVLDDEGVPTGVVEEAAQPLLADLLRPFAVDDVADALARASAVYAAQGLTHVTECGIAGGFIGRTPRELAAYQAALEHGRLLQRVVVMPVDSALHEVPGGDGVGLDLGVRTGFGDDDLRLGPMKIFFDGALSSRTAAMTAPFVDRDHAGYFQDDPGHMHRMVVGAHLAGWTVAAHAIGDRAVAAALDAFADAQAQLPRPEVRHRIEHAAVVSDAEVRRFAALGVTPVPQARFLQEIGESMIAAVGDGRADLLYRHASFVAAGLRVPASTDRPCVADGHPLRTMQAMVQRRTASGRVLGPEERVDAVTALRALTVDTAWIAGDEDRRGALAPGMLADLVVLGDDVTRVDQDRIGDTEVVATMRGGVWTHGFG
ncbi:amidohydrolase [Actinomycetospora endophytica]|uniref:Amidohydrolase n=1 Tax=Actinomycetospora endophytica TaxID=2291215 RepID=A0ABS8P503_9PSEU|nr:amidohydrolase [Actinomycetospora endophytica]MCD2192476.1 amidohydrolase [Actinomycetospora endophytica]